MGTDVERIVSGLRMLHDVWGALLDVGVATWLLERQLYLACLAPVILVVGRSTTSVLAWGIVLFTPLYLAFIGATTKLSLAANPAQRRWIEKVEERLRVTSAFLGDMKAVKMLGLSPTMSNIIQRLRIDEIKTSKAYRKLLVTMILLCKSLPLPKAFLVLLLIFSFSKYSNQPGTRINICDLYRDSRLLEERVAVDGPSFHFHRFDLVADNSCDNVHSSTSNGPTVYWQLRSHTGILQLYWRIRNK